MSILPSHRRLIVFAAVIILACAAYVSLFQGPDVALIRLRVESAKNIRDICVYERQASLANLDSGALANYSGPVSCPIVKELTSGELESYYWLVVKMRDRVTQEWSGPMDVGRRHRVPLVLEGSCDLPFSHGYGRGLVGYSDMSVEDNQPLPQALAAVQVISSSPPILEVEFDEPDSRFIFSAFYDRLRLQRFGPRK
jgi:hypothetical protein